MLLGPLLLVGSLLHISTALAQDNGACNGPHGLIAVAEDKARFERSVRTSGDWKDAAQVLQGYLDALSSDKKLMSDIFALRKKGNYSTPSIAILSEADADREIYARKASSINCGTKSDEETGKKRVNLTNWPNLSRQFGPILCIRASAEEKVTTFLEDKLWDKSTPLFFPLGADVQPDKGIVITGENSCLDPHSCQGIESVGLVKICTFNFPKSGCISYPAIPSSTELAGESENDFRLLTVAERLRANDQLMIKEVQKSLSNTDCRYPAVKPGETPPPEASPSSTRHEVSTKSPDIDLPGTQIKGVEAGKAAPPGH